LLPSQISGLEARIGIIRRHLQNYVELLPGFLGIAQAHQGARAIQAGPSISPLFSAITSSDSFSALREIVFLSG